MRQARGASVSRYLCVCVLWPFMIEQLQDSPPAATKKDATASGADVAACAAAATHPVC